MTGSTAQDVNPRALMAAAILGICAVAAALGARSLDVPGLYYDEVIQAEPAVQFLAEDGAPLEVPGMRTIRLFGGWFPVMTQNYMGAMKSQALIPVFAVFEANKVSLRATTFAWGLCGLIFTMLWANQLLGFRGAILAGVLLAVDPSFLFISRHDWGSFSLAFLCRSGGIFFALAGARRLGAEEAGALWRLGAAGLFLGAGLFNKIDSAVVLIALTLATALTAPGEVHRVFRAAARRRFAAVAVFGIGAVVGALPLLASLERALGATSALLLGGGMQSTDWSEKLHTLSSTLDGSYFHRLMLTGGSFEEMFAVEGAAASVFPALLLASGFTLVVLRFATKNDPGDRRIHAFLLLATLLAAVGIFFTPRAVRIHHVLNLYPLPHLLVAAALQSLLGRGQHTGLRAAAGLALAGSLASSVVVDVKTLEEIRSTGGRGRWSDAVERFGNEISDTPGARVVSFSWGLAGPLRFAARNTPIEEPFWKLWRPGGQGKPWVREGTRRDVYLIQEGRLAVFPFGAQFAAEISTLSHDWVEIRHHTDREGDPAFTSVRISRPHQIVYRNDFEVELR